MASGTIRNLLISSV